MRDLSHVIAVNASRAANHPNVKAKADSDQVLPSLNSFLYTFFCKKTSKTEVLQTPSATEVNLAKGIE